MGLFDSVVAPCPYCGSPVKFQSKAGECTLREYHRFEVPLAIAEDIDGDTVECRDCKRVVRLVVREDQPRTVCMRAVRD